MFSDLLNWERMDYQYNSCLSKYKGSTDKAIKESMEYLASLKEKIEL